MVDMMKPAGASYSVQRRVAGPNDIRLDGISDLLLRARKCSVLDIGCNRGMVGLEFALNGAKTVHGFDLYEKGVETAREIFADLRHVESFFEVVDLTKGPSAMAKFPGPYDVVLLLATYHKLKRVMSSQDLAVLVQHFGRVTKKYLAWRATSDKPDENEEEIRNLDRDLKVVGLQRVHTSYLSSDLGVAAIWSKP